MTARQRELLMCLYHYRDTEPVYSRQGLGWLRPIELGGRDASWHSGVLLQLVKKGLVMRRHYGSDRSWVYKITQGGVAAAQEPSSEESTP